VNRVALALVTVVIAGSCASAPARPTANPSIGGTDLAQLRTRGSLVVSIRVAVSPAGQQLDVAHSQKRALESAVVTELAKRILGPDAKVQFRELGRDRHSLVERAEADIAMISAAEPPSSNIILTGPYVAGGVVIAVKGGSTATDPRALASQIIGATTMGELNVNELAQAYL